MCHGLNMPIKKYVRGLLCTRAVTVLASASRGVDLPGPARDFGWSRAIVRFAAVISELFCNQLRNEFFFTTLSLQQTELTVGETAHMQRDCK